jgi:two-component system response regulator YesN
MLRVLLVDDEPFILQGLKVLIDWHQEGFEIAGAVSNGEEAIEFLKDNQIDLIIADVKMPIMTGLELLAKIRKEKISDAYFVILSGHADFSFAREAIRYECTDYILKPVEKEELIDILHKVGRMKDSLEECRQKNREMEQAYLARNVIELIQGKYDNLNLEYVIKHMRLSEKVRYIEIALDSPDIQEEFTDEDKRSYQRKLYQACQDFIGEDRDHCVFDVSGHENIYDTGFLYCDYMAEDKNVSEKDYLEQFLGYLQSIIAMPIFMLVGKKVTNISNIAKSYHTATILRSFQGFCSKKDIYYYEDEIQIKNGGIVLCKESMDNLIAAVEQNNRADILRNVDSFYQEMQQMGITGDTMMLNINYLLFQLIHLATQQDDGVNQEEIMRVISESTFRTGIERGSKDHLSRFSCEYAYYLAQLRKKMSRGIMAGIEKEVRDHYAENLTLKELSEKYYVNSAYLGQMFRKKYGMSFKDYLNNYRIEKAAVMLLRSDKKILQIVEEVGYHDLDYFVNRFILAKGCTPAKFRRQTREG